MKGERRHELQQNELAEWLAGVFESVRPYWNAILGALLLVVAALLVYSWSAQRSATQNAEAWNVFYKAMASGNPAEYDNVIEQFPGNRVAHWAAVMAGDVYLAEGCNQLFSSKTTANQELRKAVENYMLVLEESQESMLRERATFGLARAREAQGDLAKASEGYQQVVRNWPEGAYAKTAERRLEDLKDPATMSFYDKFAKYDPKPAFSDEPGTPGKRPEFDLDSLPEEKPAATPSDFLDLKETAPGGEKPGE